MQHPASSRAAPPSAVWRPAGRHDCSKSVRVGGASAFWSISSGDGGGGGGGGEIKMALFINLDALFSHHGQMKAAGGWKMGSGRMTAQALLSQGGHFSARGLK